MSKQDLAFWHYELDRLLPRGKSQNWILSERSIRRNNHLLNLLDSEQKNIAGSKNCVIKRKLKLEDFKNCLEAAQIENKINHLEKHKIDEDSLKEDHKKFIKNDKLILKTQQRFKSEKHNVFTEEINKTVLSSNYDTRIQSIFSI